MRGHRRTKTIPTVETLEGKTLPSATIAGLHTFVTPSGTTVTVEREQFRQQGGQILLDLQLRGGGQRIHETYRLRSSGPARSATADEAINLFLNNAAAGTSGPSGTGFDTQGDADVRVESVHARSRRDNTTYAATLDAGGARVSQTVSIRSSRVRGARTRNAFTATDALNLLALDLSQKRQAATATTQAKSSEVIDTSFIVAPVGGFPAFFGTGRVGGGLGVGPSAGFAGGTGPTQGFGLNGIGTGTGINTGTGTTGTNGPGTTGTNTSGTGTTGIGTATTGTGIIGTGNTGTTTTTSGTTTVPVGTVIGQGGTGTNTNGGLIFGPVSPVSTGTGGTNTTGTGTTSIGQTNTGTAGTGSQATGSNTNTTG